MPAYSRDPLSIAFGSLADQTIGRLLGDPWVTVAFKVTSLPGDRGEDEGGLSETERAIQRALYYALNSTPGVEGPLGGRAAPNPDWSLMRGWGPPVYHRTGFLRRERRRTVWLTVVPKPEARAAVARRPAATRWVDTPDLQSGGTGSTKARF